MDKKVRPSLASHGGDVHLVDADNGRVFIELSGGCQGCALSRATLKGGIERLVKEEFPNVTEVVDLTDHSQGKNPYR